MREFKDIYFCAILMAAFKLSLSLKRNNRNENRRSNHHNSFMII